MALLAITVEQILNLIQQLPRDRKQVIDQALNQELVAERETNLDEETKAWLEAGLTEPIPKYD
jgi:predicted transcriptional regulator